MASNMTEEEALRWSSFTTDTNLTPDTFIVFQDMDKTHSDMVDRYYVLKNKQYTTDAEKTEMTQLEVNLQEYLPTSDVWNKLCACIMTMQIFMRDGIVIFMNQQKEEFMNIIKNYSDKGNWIGTTTYSTGNLVRRNGNGFLSKVDNNLNHEPNNEVSNDDYWIKFTIKGDKGDPSLNISIKKGTDGTANYDPLTTYNIGDACVYNHRLYYCLVDGTIGIMVTDTTKWACADKIWIGTDEPLDHFVIWWDTNVGQNVLKRYSDNNEWVSQNVKASDVLIVDSGNLYTSINVEGALQEVMTKVNTIDLTASKVNVIDSANLYTGTNAETCLAEAMTKINTAQARADSAFTYANNGKTSVTGVVGNVSSGNTFTQITNEIQIDKNTLATNLNNKGVSASNGDTLRNLASLVGNITIQSLGGVKRVKDSITVAGSSTSFTISGFNFTPLAVLCSGGYTDTHYFSYENYYYMDGIGLGFRLHGNVGSTSSLDKEGGVTISNGSVTITHPVAYSSLDLITYKYEIYG